MKLTHALFSLALTTALCGCAEMNEPAANVAPAVKHNKPAMTKSQCRKMKSFKQGQLDGQQGKSKTEFADLAESCSPHKVKLQEKKYVQGWNQGNKSYCQPKNMIKLAKQGQTFPEACQNQRVAERAYEKAKKSSDQRAEVSSDKNGILSAAQAMNTPVATPGKLAELETQLQDIRENKSQVQNDLDFFRDGVVHNQREQQLQELSSRENDLIEQIKSVKQAKANDVNRNENKVANVKQVNNDFIA